MPPHLEVIAQFTEDTAVTKDRICDSQKQCHGYTPVIPEGHKVFYVTSRNPAVPGRFVCEACYLWYLRKPTTTVRPSAAVASGSSQHAASVPPDAALIRQAVNAGQRGSTMDAPSVIHVPRASGPIQRGLTSHPHNQIRGPVIATPGTSGQAPGYSSNHAHYARERDYWAQAAAHSANVNTISLTISAVYEGSKRGQSQGIPFGNIKEGKKNIDCLTSAQGLICIARDTVTPKIKAFCPDFPWRTSEFVVRDSGWVDLSTYPQSEPYFYRDCLVTNRKNSKPVFKTKCFPLMVVVPAPQWQEYERFMDSEERGRKTSQAPTRVMVGPSRHLAVQPSASLADFTILRSPGHNDTALRSLAEVSPTTGDRTQPTTPRNKRGHHHTSSSNSIVTNGTRPTSKKAASAATQPASENLNSKAATIATIVSPPRDAIRQALERGGTANVDVNLVISHVTETITFHPINLCPFDEILKDCMESDSDAADNQAAWQLDPMGGLTGQLTINKSQKGLIGVGAFKTAHDRVLSLVSLTSSGLGSKQRQKVVVKQPFFRSRSATGKVNIIQRYTLSTDLSKLFREANILYWAKSLLDLTYTFVDAATKSSATPPPFNVPQLRFVDAGLALIHSSASKTATGVYLVEEKILCSPREFIKYIHNSDFGPSIESDENGYDIAKFLIFTQHVQYMKTKGLAFISDYQGNSSLLTDPQILTDPSLGLGQDMFGDSNLTSGVKMFKEKHICNCYCRWPAFGLKEFEHDDEPQDSEGESLVH